MKRPISILVAIAMVLSVVAVAPAPAAAADDGGSIIDDFADEDEADEEQSRVASAFDYLSGVFGYAQGRFAAARDHAGLVLGGDDGVTAEESAAEVGAYFNERAGSFQAYANDRVIAAESRDVLELTYEIDGESATHYLVTDVENDTYANASVVESTDRTVDHQCTLSGTAAESAASELTTVFEAYVDADETVSKRYLGKLHGQYSAYVSCSFL